MQQFMKKNIYNISHNALDNIHYKIFKGIHISKEERKEEGSYSERKRKTLSRLSCATYVKR